MRFYILNEIAAGKYLRATAIGKSHQENGGRYSHFPRAFFMS